MFGKLEIPWDENVPNREILLVYVSPKEIILFASTSNYTTFYGIVHQKKKMPSLLAVTFVSKFGKTNPIAHGISLTFWAQVSSQ